MLHSNERAIHFYKNSGFEQVGNHDFQIGKESFEFVADEQTALKTKHRHSDGIAPAVNVEEIAGFAPGISFVPVVRVPLEPPHETPQGLYKQRSLVHVT